MQIVINPGSGPVEGATEDNAVANIEAFIADLAGRADPVRVVNWWRRPAADADGRYGFVLGISDREVEVDMPGLPLPQVRWVGEEGQNIWDSPRLYVDGASWIWEFALDVCGPEEEDE